MCEHCKVYSRKDVDTLFENKGIHDQDRFFFKCNNVCVNVDHARNFSIVALAHYFAGRQLGYHATMHDLETMQHYMQQGYFTEPFDSVGHDLASYVLFRRDEINYDILTAPSVKFYEDFRNKYGATYAPEFFHPVYDDVDFSRWSDAEGNSLPNRISKVIFDKIGIKIPEMYKCGARYPDKFFAAYGNALRNYYLDNLDLYVLIDRDFSWKDGDFGDKNSCIFNPDGINAHQLPTLKSSCMAVKIYAVENGIPVRGIGRALLSVASENNEVILFNGYGAHPLSGTSRDNSVINILAVMLADHYKFKTIPIRFSGNGSIYTNMSKGILLTTGETDHLSSTYYPRLFPHGDPGFWCHGCHDNISDQPANVFEDHNYCRNCYDGITFVCKGCGQRFNTYDKIVVHRGGRHATARNRDFYCHTCFRQQETIRCTGCACYYYKHDLPENARRCLTCNGV